MPPKSMRVGLTDAGVDVSTDGLDFAAFTGRAVGENGLGECIDAPRATLCAAYATGKRARQVATSHEGAKDKN